MAAHGDDKTKKQDDVPGNKNSDEEEALDKSKERTPITELKHRIWDLIEDWSIKTKQKGIY